MTQNDIPRIRIPELGINSQKNYLLQFNDKDTGNAIDLAGETIYVTFVDTLGDSPAVISKRSDTIADLEILAPTTDGQAILKIDARDHSLSAIEYEGDVVLQLGNGAVPRLIAVLLLNISETATKTFL